MTNEEAIAIMCRRCSQHEMCMGTGCSPKSTLQALIDKDEKLIDEVDYGEKTNRFAALK